MEGIIKAVTCEPVKVWPESETKASNCMVKIIFDAKGLADLYTLNGVDPADVTAPFIVVEEGIVDVDDINLAEAVATGHEISTFAFADIAYVGD